MAIKPKKVPAVKKPTIDDVYGGTPAPEAPAAEAAPEPPHEPAPAPADEPAPVPEAAKAEETMTEPATAPEPTEPEPSAPAPAPEAAPEPAPEPAAQSAAPEPVAPEPAAAPEPVAEAPAPVAEPEPEKAAEPEKAPEPVAAPESIAAPAPEAPPVAAIETPPAPVAAVAPPAPAPAPSPRRRPVLYAVTAVSLLLSAATTAAIATLPVWQGELRRAWEQADPAAAGAFLIAAQGVSRAAAGSAPFAGAIDVARALAPEGQAPIAAALDRVAAFADKGAPALPTLRARFETVAAAIRDSARPRNPNPGWVERTVDELSAALPVGNLMNSSLFGGAPATASPPALRNAEVLLAAGNLGDAVASVRSLGSAPVALASAWLTDAQRRIDLDDAARTLERLAVEHHKSSLAQPSLEERLDRLVKAAEDHLFK